MVETLLPKLNFPESKFRINDIEGKLSIYDVVRRKFVALTPEEWVRQNCIHFLNNSKGFSTNLMGVEKGFDLNGKKLRFDIVAYSNSGMPKMLVECKAPEVKLTQATVDQIVVYNMKLNVPLLMMTNGLTHIFCRVTDKGFSFLRDLPSYQELVAM